MKTVMTLIAMVAMAGCGANGAPFTPTSGGSVSFGTNGVSAETTVGATNGNVTFGLTQGVSRR